MSAKHTPTPKYDDMLPVSVMGGDFLDRHNDRIATFEPTVEIEDRARIVRAVNSHNERENLIAVLLSNLQHEHEDAMGEKHFQRVADGNLGCFVCSLIAKALGKS